MLDVSVIESDAFKPKIGQQFVILDNDGELDEIIGSFDNENGIVEADGCFFWISYQGLDGGGNDVVLTVVAFPSTRHPRPDRS